MAGIGDIQLSVTQDGNWFFFTLNWTCYFEFFTDPPEVDFSWQTWWELKELDDTSADDIVDSTVSPHVHSAMSGRILFQPRIRNPSDPYKVRFTETRQWHRSDVDTELGGEEIYALASLYNATLQYQAADVKSNRLDVSP